MINLGAVATQGGLKACHEGLIQNARIHLGWCYPSLLDLDQQALCRVVLPGTLC